MSNYIDTANTYSVNAMVLRGALAHAEDNGEPVGRQEYLHSRISEEDAKATRSFRRAYATD